MNVTGQQLLDSMRTNSITSVPYGTCSTCKQETSFLRIDDCLYYNPTCRCEHRPIQKRDWDAVADWINTLVVAEEQQRILTAFGFTEETGVLSGMQPPVAAVCTVDPTHRFYYEEGQLPVCPHCFVNDFLSLRKSYRSIATILKRIQSQLDDHH